MVVVGHRVVIRHGVIERCGVVVWQEGRQYVNVLGLVQASPIQTAVRGRLKNEEALATRQSHDAVKKMGEKTEQRYEAWMLKLRAGLCNEGVDVREGGEVAEVRPATVAEEPPSYGD